MMEGGFRMIKGMVTEIQRFSLNDGPGIRTTVFLKGCNMRCAWCHNPETISGKRELHFYPQKCIGCYRCISVCPSKAHKLIGGEHRIFRNLCTHCGKCAAVCYAQALEMSGKPLSVEEVMAEVVQDKAYYRDSGGGVTLSGGEVFCQPAFSLALVSACRQEGIPAAIETNLSFPYPDMEPVLKAVELVMCDLKIWDGAQHKRWTGIGNARIVENIKRLDALGKPFIVRTPLIPGATDSRENVEHIAGFLRGLKNLRYYELLNYNPLGGSKYQSLSLPNPFEKARPLPKKALEELTGAAQGKGLAVKCA